MVHWQGDVKSFHILARGPVPIARKVAAMISTARTTKGTKRTGSFTRTGATAVLLSGAIAWFTGAGCSTTKHAPTQTPNATATTAANPTATSLPAGTATTTRSATSSHTSTQTRTGTQTQTATPMPSATASATRTASRTATASRTSTRTFTTSSTCAATQSCTVVATPVGLVNLGTAGNFAVLAMSGISTVPASAITGDIGVSPAAATYITGFSLTMDSSNQYSTSTQVVGNVYASDYSPPTPANMTTAILDMQTAYTDAAGRAAGVTELGAGNIGGLTLVPGVYSWSSGLLIPTNVTLAGSATDVWIFQIAQNLTVSNGTIVQLSGGAQAQNIFWQVAGLVDAGTTSHLEGNILTYTSIALQTGASINGRLLAQTAVTLDSSTVVQP